MTRAIFCAMFNVLLNLPASMNTPDALSLQLAERFKTENGFDLTEIQKSVIVAYILASLRQHYISIPVDTFEDSDVIERSLVIFIEENRHLLYSTPIDEYMIIPENQANTHLGRLGSTDIVMGTYAFSDFIPRKALPKE